MKSQLAKKVSTAVRHFWTTREHQQQNQGKVTGRRDYGSRGAVTGGKQLDGFVQLVRSLLVESGLSGESVHCDWGRVALPGYFRPTKEWDLLIIADGKLLATIEFKSHIGPSFGNNFNNRTEEAVGSATDLWTAYREGAFQKAPRPWLGYFILLEEAKSSTTPVRLAEPHFKVFPEFRETSYIQRYQLLCQRLVRERLYDAACLITSTREDGLRGKFREPIEGQGFAEFAMSLTSHVGAYVKLRT